MFLRNTVFEYKWPKNRIVAITNLPVYIPFNLADVAIDVTLGFVSSLAKKETLLTHFDTFCTKERQSYLLEAIRKEVICSKCVCVFFNLNYLCAKI